MQLVEVTRPSDEGSQDDSGSDEMLTHVTTDDDALSREVAPHLVMEVMSQDDSGSDDMQLLTVPSWWAGIWRTENPATLNK